VAVPLATGRYILFLNPDCIIGPDVVKRMSELMKNHPDAGMAGCLIRNLDGSEQVGCRRMVPTPWRTLIRILHLNTFFPNQPFFRSFVLANSPLPTAPTNIEALSGAFMFVSRKAFAEVGPLDENYFMHCEDLDWCMRFRAAGYSIIFAPHVEITHVKGSCSINSVNKVLWHKHLGMIRFYRKFFRHQYPFPIMQIVIVSIWCRFAIIRLVSLVKRWEPKQEI
jgi:GT2 family glycosyltransferase